MPLIEARIKITDLKRETGNRYSLVEFYKFSIKQSKVHGKVGTKQILFGR